MFKDFGTNILGSVVLVAALQLGVYPYLAKVNSPEEYGILLTLMGIVNIIIVSLGNLNNIRLVQHIEYVKRKVQGDFNVILIGSLLFGSLCLYIINRLFVKVDDITIALLILILLVGICRSYYSVAYRLKLNFTMQMVLRFIITIGYIVGLIAVPLTIYWPLVFIVGEISGLVFILFTSDVIWEAIKVTPLFKQTLMKYIALIVAGLIGNLIVYLDRLVLYPTLGSAAVSTYTVASFFGKSVSLILIPIAGVLLGYYAQANFNMTRRLFWRINLLVAIFSGIFFVVSLFIAEWFTGLLYPTLIDSAYPYIILANVAAIIGATGSMTQPAVLRYSPMRWQIIIQIIHGLIYFIGGLILIHYFNILGFCIAAIGANLTRLLTLYWVGNRSLS